MNIVKDLVDYLGKIFTWWVVIMPWQQGVRVSFGKRVDILHGGVYLKLPLIHTIYVQEKRLRAVNLPIQTVSSKDGFAFTVSLSVGYSIVDIRKLYNTLYQPDMTIASMVSSKVSEFIFNHSLSECNPRSIEVSIEDSMHNTDYGLEFKYIRVVNFASVKTFRIIQDQSQMWEGLDLLTKR